MAAKVLGIGGVFFEAKDPKGLMAWYQKWLGFPREYLDCAMFPPASMPEGACTVFNPLPPGTDYFSRPGMGPVDSEDAQRFMVSFVVDDLSLALEQVRSGGGTVLDTKREDFGVFGWFLDPDGNKVEMWEPAK
jgi:predicted enzyme related to lactoylglutathione lyase